jgi:predicted nucleic acid-binding protein
MMRTPVLVDTGPIVAVLTRTDSFHGVCVDQLRSLTPPLLTCWPVLTEASWLLRKQPRALDRLFSSFDSGLFRLVDLDESDMPWLARFLLQYRTLGTQLADAALVCLAERDEINTVFTLDRRDFSVYRLSRNRALRLLPEQ